MFRNVQYKKENDQINNNSLRLYCLTYPNCTLVPIDVNSTIAENIYKIEVIIITELSDTYDITHFSSNQ